MKENIEAEHIKNIKGAKSYPDQGYPDTGSGLYSKKLSYKDWFEFNLTQRVHANFLE